MGMKFSRRTGITLATGVTAAAAAAGLLFGAPSANAQLDPSTNVDGKSKSFDIIQFNHKVGEIFVPDRASGSTSYLEHWVLFSDYKYPGKANPTATITIKEGDSTYSDLQDFFSKVPFGSGSKYVKVDSHESAALPQS
ncbi:hypothetical protein ACWCQK_40465 [Streptomyces sp. NPDC002306]